MSTLSTIKTSLDSLLLEGGRPTVSSIENAAHLLRQFQEQLISLPVEAAIAHDEVTFGEMKFGTLRMGESPVDLHPLVQQAWNDVEDRWACASTLEASEVMQSVVYVAPHTQSYYSDGFEPGTAHNRGEIVAVDAPDKVDWELDSLNPAL